MIKEFLPEHTPVISYLELTLRCNHHCVQCYLEGTIPDAQEELTREEIKTVFGNLADRGSLIAVVTGGEPLLRPDALDILRDLRALGYAVVLFSNGSLITEAVAKQLYDIALLAVEISLHGPAAEIHDRVTGVPGSFDRAVSAIRLLHENQVRVKLKCNLLKANNGDVNAIIALAEKLGVEYTLDPFIYPRRDGNTDPVDQRLSVDHIRRILGDPRLDGEPVRPGSRSYLSNGDKPLCGIGENIINISCNGDVLPCVPFKRAAGNIRTQPVKDIWEKSPLFTHLRSLRNRDLTNCPSCGLLNYCTRCTAAVYNETGILLGCSSLCRQVAEARRLMTTDMLVHA